MECFDAFKYKYRKWWKHYRTKLLCDHVRVAYLLSPNPVVQKHAMENLDGEDRLACERLLVKLFVKNYVEDDLRSETEKSEVVDKFWKEYGVTDTYDYVLTSLYSR